MKQTNTERRDEWDSRKTDKEGQRMKQTNTERRDEWDSGKTSEEGQKESTETYS